MVQFMFTTVRQLYRSSYFAWSAALISLVFLSPLLTLTVSAQSNETLPLSQVRPGMQGYAYTIFAGDQVEKFDLEVIGVMPNFLGPQQSIILVQLKGPKVEHTRSEERRVGKECRSRCSQHHYKQDCTD